MNRYKLKLVKGQFYTLKLLQNIGKDCITVYQYDAIYKGRIGNIFEFQTKGGSVFTVDLEFDLVTETCKDEHNFYELITIKPYEE